MNFSECAPREFIHINSLDLSIYLLFHQMLTVEWFHFYYKQRSFSCKIRFRWNTKLQRPNENQIWVIHTIDLILVEYLWGILTINNSDYQLTYLEIIYRQSTHIPVDAEILLSISSVGIKCLFLSFSELVPIVDSE